MARVLLKRHWRTPLGRFDRSLDGVPTEIPNKVIARWRLPSDAEEVNDDYQTPEEIAEETLGDSDLLRTAAEQEKELNRRVNEELDRREKEKAKASSGDEENTGPVTDLDPEENPGPVTDPDPEGQSGEKVDILDLSVKDIVDQLGDFEFEPLSALLSREKEGKNRSTLIVEIEAAMEDFE